MRDVLLNALIALLKPTNPGVHKHKILQGMTSLPVPREPYILGQVGTFCFLYRVERYCNVLYKPNVRRAVYLIDNLMMLRKIKGEMFCVYNREPKRSCY